MHRFDAVEQESDHAVAAAAALTDERQQLHHQIGGVEHRLEHQHAFHGGELCRAIHHPHVGVVLPIGEKAHLTEQFHRINLNECVHQWPLMEVNGHTPFSQQHQGIDRLALVAEHRAFFGCDHLRVRSCSWASSSTFSRSRKASSCGSSPHMRNLAMGSYPSKPKTSSKKMI